MVDEVGTPVLVLVTLPVEETDAVARALVEPRLAACVSVLPAMKSLYWWKGELRNDPGVMLVIKTERAALERIEQAIRQASNEDVFELLVVDVTGGSSRYLEWLADEVRIPPNT